MTYFKDLFHRLGFSWRWILAQFVGILLFLVIGLAWTRLPEKHWWQVALSMLIPVLLAISILELQAGTMRRLADDDGKRVKLVWGAATLLVWAAMFCACWVILDWCDDRIPLWASYLNSRAPAHARGALFTFDHIQRLLTCLEWILRWIVVPAKIVPYAMASALGGWRFSWGRVLRILWNWRWWPAMVLAALVGIWLPGHLFDSLPSGSVQAQVWHVGLKLAASYLLGVGCWVLLLGWLAVLWSGQPEPDEDALDQDLFRRLSASRRWVGAWFGWMVLSDLLVVPLSDSQSWIKMVLTLVLLALGCVLVAGTMRSLMDGGGKGVRLVWGTLSQVVWAALGLGIALLLSLWYNSLAQWSFRWVVAPALVLPLAAASALWGFRLPWRRVWRLLLNWRWWLGVLWAAIAGLAVPSLISSATSGEAAAGSLWSKGLIEGINGLLDMGSWVLLLGWLATLFSRQLEQPPVEEALVPASVLTGPGEKSISAKAEVPPDQEPQT